MCSEVTGNLSLVFWLFKGQVTLYQSWIKMGSQFIKVASKSDQCRAEIAGQSQIDSCAIFMSEQCKPGLISKSWSFDWLLWWDLLEHFFQSAAAATDQCILIAVSAAVRKQCPSRWDSSIHLVCVDDGICMPKVRWIHFYSDLYILLSFKDGHTLVMFFNQSDE